MDQTDGDPETKDHGPLSNVSSGSSRRKADEATNYQVHESVNRNNLKNASILESGMP
jgi:hypothetical protein